MQKKPIIVFAGKADLKFYRNIFSNEERIVEYPILNEESIISSSEPDMVLLDCGFNPENGLRLLNMIKSLKPHVPVIFLTDKSSETIAIDAFRAGAFDYFNKPIDYQALRYTIANLLEVKRSQRDTRKRVYRPVWDKNNVAEAKELPSELFHIVCYIDNNIASSLTVERLAGEANLSKYHFCRHFKRHTGMTPMNFVISRRVEIAKKLLQKNGNPNISTVAYQVGYNNINNFTRSFKKITGFSPSAYWKSFKEHILLPKKSKIHQKKSNA